MGERMELRRYWGIVWRYRLVVLALPLLVGLIATARWFATPSSYTAQARVEIVLAPPQATAGEPDFFRYDNYYKYLATEYAVDDLVEVLNGNAFAAVVAATLNGPEYNIAIKNEEVQGAIKARRTHRVLVLETTSGDRDRAIKIGWAAILTVQRDPLKYFTNGDLGPKQGAAVLQIDQPLVAHSDRVRRALNVVLQTMVALFAGLGLAFLLEYLNDRLRDADAARDALGLPVLGQIPGGAGRSRGVA